MAESTMIGGLTNGTADLTDKIEIETSGGLSKYLTIAQIQTLLGANSWKNLPIGFEYVQRSGQSAPGTLFGGGTWSNVSSSWAGLFERIEGTATYGSSAAFGSTQDDRMQGHWHNIRDDNAKIMLAVDSGSGPDSAPHYNFYDATHTPLGSFKAMELMPDGTHGNPRADSSETRPANSTIRIWRLTAY